MAKEYLIYANMRPNASRRPIGMSGIKDTESADRNNSNDGEGLNVFHGDRISCREFSRIDPNQSAELI